MKSLIFSLFFGLLAFVIACGSVSKTYPEKKFYLIELDKLNSDEIPPKGTAFKIRRLSLSQKFEGKEFVYRRDNVNFESDFYHTFFISPSANLREEIAKGLLDQKIFEFDANQNARWEPTHFIEVSVSDLYGDFRNEPKAILNLEAFVYTETGLNVTLLLKKNYQKSISINKKEASDLVVGWNRALSEILKEMQQDLRGKIQK